MKQLISPKQIDVKVPRPDAQGSTYGVNMHTALFRWGSFLPEALDIAVGRAEDPARLKVASAACSIGAEADSILALHRQGGYEGEVVLNGYDLNELALAAARKGTYGIRGTEVHGREELSARLEALGFRTSNVLRDISGPERLEKIREARLMAVRPPLSELDTELVADAVDLRDGHEVGFRGHDLHDPLPDPEQDLVLANNLLYHMGAEESIEVARSLAASLAESGVLSFGGGTLLEPLWWADRLTGVLYDEFRLEPIFSEERYGDPAPVMFGRN